MQVLRSLVVTVVALVVLAAPSVVLADGRVALVVGNSTYAHIGRLPNPENDAVGMSAALRRPGFEVTIEFDLGASVRRVVDEVKEQHRRHHHLRIDN